MNARSSFCSKRTSGFTLVELLVVIGIIGLLISILLPTLNKARAAAMQVSCSSNLRQFGNAFRMYADNNKGILMPVGYLDGGPDPFWPVGINNYMLKSPKGTLPGREFMRCPMLKRGGASDLSSINTYGVNYLKLFYYPYDGSVPRPWYQLEPRKLASLNSNHFLAADSVGPYIYSPTVYGFNVDNDRDGTIDSASALGYEAMYNRFDPRHNKSANVLYADGHVSPVAMMEWVTNKDKIWDPNG